MSGECTDAKLILVPVTGDAHSDDAFRRACRMARQSKAQLHAIHVIEVPMDRTLEHEDAQATDGSEKILARIEAIASSEKYKHLQARSLRARHAGPAVVLEAEDRKMDAVILSVPYKRRFGSCSMGATASYVFDNAPCRVILWREPTPVLAEF